MLFSIIHVSEIFTSTLIKILRFGSQCFSWLLLRLLHPHFVKILIFGSQCLSWLFVRLLCSHKFTKILRIRLRCKNHYSAVYTCIKKPESFSHLGFSLKVAKQLPLNTPKNQNRKTHLRSVIFWNSAEISLVFCQCKRSLQSRRYYLGFWSRGTWLSAESPDRGPRRNAHYTCTVKGREVAHAHHLPKHKYEIRVFSRMRFSCQKPRMLWVFLAV